MRELIGAEAFGSSGSRILDYRFETRRRWFGGARVVCTIVTEAREFSGQGGCPRDAADVALEAWERHFLDRENSEALDADPPSDDSGYMASQVFADRKPTGSQRIHL